MTRRRNAVQEDSEEYKRRWKRRGCWDEANKSAWICSNNITMQWWQIKGKKNSIKCVSKKAPPLQFHYISLSSQGRATKTALPCICWQISLPAVGETLMSTRWDCMPHPPLWTNKIRVKMKSIITADIFISGLPYLITNFFQGFLEEFILWASLSLLLRICWKRKSCFIAVGLIVAHSLSSLSSKEKQQYRLKIQLVEMTYSYVSVTDII